jgi:dTDP-glucose 4,6-dehydratase
MNRTLNNILVTGGCGFIGSHFIRYVLTNQKISGTLVNIDNLSYSGNPANVTDIEKKFPKQYEFVKTDINENLLFTELLQKYKIECIVHFAAQTHVDRSISSPEPFIKSNINGTFSMLESVRNVSSAKTIHFHHISTDEVYGSLGETGYFYETTAYAPNSPYSASKAASDHLVRSYFKTFNIPITISNCSNNYGPNQYPEKLIPLMIDHCLAGKKLPVYGDGKNIRDWLYVEDHVEAVWKIIKSGPTGEVYNIGGDNEWTNIKLVQTICHLIASEKKKDPEKYLALIEFVKDRPGHDRRYAINCDKIKSELGWKQRYNFRDGLQKTIKWYLTNQEWTGRIKNGIHQM